MIIATGFENADPMLIRDLLVIAAAAVGLALGVKKLFFEPKLSDKYATVAAVAKLEADLQAQMKEMRSYVHEMMHAIRNDISAIAAASDNARDGIHDRLNVIVEVLYRMRGQLDGPPSGRGQT